MKSEIIAESHSRVADVQARLSGTSGRGGGHGAFWPSRLGERRSTEDGRVRGVPGARRLAPRRARWSAWRRGGAFIDRSDVAGLGPRAVLFAGVSATPVRGRGCSRYGRRRARGRPLVPGRVLPDVRNRSMRDPALAVANGECARSGTW